MWHRAPSYSPGGWATWYLYLPLRGQGVRYTLGASRKTSYVRSSLQEISSGGQDAASGSQPWMVRQDTNKKNDAANRTRTCDMLVNSQPLYQLSYGGTGISAL